MLFTFISALFSLSLYFIYLYYELNLYFILVPCSYLTPLLILFVNFCFGVGGDDSGRPKAFSRTALHQPHGEGGIHKSMHKHIRESIHKHIHESIRKSIHESIHKSIHKHISKSCATATCIASYRRRSRRVPPCT